LFGNYLAANLLISSVSPLSIHLVGFFSKIYINNEKVILFILIVRLDKSDQFEICIFLWGYFSPFAIFSFHDFFKRFFPFLSATTSAEILLNIKP